ncbi:MAG: hypothetical protein V1698_03210 [bacterium]
MVTISISQKKFQKMKKLYDRFYEIYGDNETVWDLSDLDNMREMGQEFMDIFAVNFKE